MQRKKNSATRMEKVRTACAAIDTHVQELVEQMRQGKSENLVRYLEFSAQFHQYSFGNILLALAQRRDISRLAGMRQWNKVGRRVRSGEKGIMILAPMTVRKRKAEDSEEVTDKETEPATITFFKPVYVFDIRQTEGKPVPMMLHAAGNAAELVPALQACVREANIALEIAGSVGGSRSSHGASYGGRVQLRSDLDPADAFRTLAHEFAHEKLHWRGVEEGKTIYETEADATAFVVCRHFGITCDTSDYLLLYDSSPKLVLQRLETIRRTANETIVAVTDQLPQQNARLNTGVD